MNLANKFIIGLAQSDPDYGINTKGKFKQVFNLATENGYRFFDTAANYKNSHLYLRSISGLTKTKIISKLSFDDEFNKNFKKKIKLKILEILKKNKLKKIYGLLIHDPLLPLNENKWPIIYKELINFKKKGIIKKIGISVYNRFELDQILDVFKPDIVQFPLNVFNQSFNDKNYLRKLKKKKIELHARSIFLQGILLKNYKNYQSFFKWKENFIAWNNFLKINKLSSLNACLRFVLQNKLIDKFVIGLNNKNHFNDFIFELARLKKNNKKKYDFSALDSNDEILKDSRYWNQN
jgi:aryl-alcohol dehydrogenase-like predicted oxidoreductase